MMREMATLPGGRRKETLDRIILYLRYEAAKEKAVAPALKNDHVKEKNSQVVETVYTLIYAWNTKVLQKRTYMRSVYHICR